MARLIVLYNPLDVTRRRTHELPVGRDLGLWLDQVEPVGGTLTRLVYLNGETLEPHGYMVRGHDEILVVMRPGAVIIPYIIQAVIAAAISYVLGKIFAPGKPSAGNTPAPSQVYGIAPTRNAARLGEPIPVVYGAPIVTPDYASQPYTQYVNNEQIFNAILCIGQGFHDVLEMLMGDSSAAGLPADVASFTVFNPNDHNSTIGVIRAATGVWENMSSSSDVSDQELLAPNATSSSTPSTWFWSATLVQTASSIPAGALDLRGLTQTQMLAALPQNPALGVQAVGAISSSGSPVTYQIVTWTSTAYNSAGQIPPYSLVPPPVVSGAPFDRWVGPFETAKPGQAGGSIELDYVLPGGLFSMDNNGNLTLRSVDLLVEYTQINDSGAAIAAPITRVESFAAANNTPQRHTRGFAVIPGRYRVRIKRTTFNDGKANTSDSVRWTGLKAYLDAPATTVYGAVTLVVVKLKATNGVASDAASAIRFRVNRRLAPLGVGVPVATVNPADAFVDIMTAAYGGNRPNNGDELDLPLLAELRAKWAYHNGFNAVFDQPSTVWEALGLSVQTVVAAPLPVGSRMSLIEDAPQPVRVQLFTDANTVAGSLSVTHQWDRAGTPAGVRVEFRDPRTFSNDAVFEPPGAPDYQSINLFGCTSRVVAQQHADLTMDRRQLQRVNATFMTELEGLSCLPGQRIGIQSKTMRWGSAAWVVLAQGLELHVSERMPWQGGALHTVSLRDPTGRPYQVVGVTRGETDDIIVLPDVPPFPIRDTHGTSEPTQLAFGVQGLEVTDWTVQRMRPQGAQVTIECVNYVPAVWNRAAPHQRAG